MRINIISNNYFPEDSGIGLYSGGMAEFLARQNDVKVIAATPYYPQWKIYPEYQNAKLFSRETINGVEILRFRQYTPENPTFVKRIFQMVHFFMGSVVNVLKLKHNDLTIVVIPFTVSAFLGWFLRAIRGGKLWIHIQDFEFDAAFETGISSRKDGLLHKAIFRIEHFILNRADGLSTISNGMLKKLASKTNTPGIFFPNWVDHSKIDPAKAVYPVIFNKKKFNILYSGNIGAKQDWDFFVAFADALKPFENIQVTLIGEGAKAKEIVRRIKDFPNISYFPPVRYEELNNIICSADLHILFQKKTVVDTVMPSKILGMMASGIPSLVTGHHDSEVRLNFEKASYGYYLSDDNVETAVSKALHLAKCRDEAKERGITGRPFAIENFSFEKIMLRFQDQLALVAGLAR